MFVGCRPIDRSEHTREIADALKVNPYAPTSLPIAQQMNEMSELCACPQAILFVLACCMQRMRCCVLPGCSGDVSGKLPSYGLQCLPSLLRLAYTR